jgi:hypothetical protein
MKTFSVILYQAKDSIHQLTLVISHVRTALCSLLTLHLQSPSGLLHKIHTGSIHLMAVVELSALLMYLPWEPPEMCCNNKIHV